MSNATSTATTTTAPFVMSAAQTQGLSALATIVALIAYTLWPDGRGASLQVLCLIPVLTMFVLKPQELLLTGTFSVGLLLITLTALSVLPLSPTPFDLMNDGLSGLMVCLILPMVVAFAHRYAQRREHMTSDRLTIQDTLAKMNEMAARDPLTGLFNQQHMSETLNQEFKRAQRANSPMSVALIDLDHLRAYNEQHGHDGGDQCLSQFAKLLAEAFRENEVVARWGGAAFMVIFTDSHLEQAATGLERLRQSVASQKLGLTFSAGLVGRRDGDRLDDVLGRAQTSLQRAKAQGRDRVISTP